MICPGPWSVAIIYRLVQSSEERSRVISLALYVPSTEGKGAHIIDFGVDLHSFIPVRYLLNHRMDFDQNRIDTCTLLGGQKEMTRFWSAH